LTVGRPRRIASGADTLHSQHERQLSCRLGAASARGLTIGMLSCRLVDTGTTTTEVETQTDRVNREFIADSGHRVPTLKVDTLEFGFKTACRRRLWILR
jgi:hypothetical protein